MTARDDAYLLVSNPHYNDVRARFIVDMLTADPVLLRRLADEADPQGVDSDGEIVAIEPLPASVAADPRMLSGSNGWIPTLEEAVSICAASIQEKP